MTQNDLDNLAAEFRAVGEAHIASEISAGEFNILAISALERRGRAIIALCKKANDMLAVEQGRVPLP